MTKHSLYQFYLNLIPNLITELYFFIPEKEIRPDIVEEMTAITKYIHLNKVYVLDHHKGPIEYSKERNAIDTTLKGNKLEKNIFTLLEKKGNTKPHEFNYVLNKYFELVSVLFYITDWMNAHADEHVTTVICPNGLLHLQFFNFKKHFETIIKEFYPSEEAIPQGSFNAHKMIETYFSDISKGFKPIATIVVDKPMSLNLPNNTQKATIIKTKKPLLTEVEAEKLLLKTIFGIE